MKRGGAEGETLKEKSMMNRQTKFKTINGKPCKAISAGKLEVAPDTNQGLQQ